MKSRLRFPLAKATTALSLLILAACSTAQTPPPPAISPAQTDGHRTKPLACTDFAPMTFNPGKPGATWKDIEDAAVGHPDNPLGWVRSVLGDTLSTRTAISNYAAARRALGCE